MPIQLTKPISFLTDEFQKRHPKILLLHSNLLAMLRQMELSLMLVVLKMEN